MFNPSRDQARQFLFDAWQKTLEHRPLTPLEDMASRIIADHPEYQALLENREQHAERDYRPEDGETNPFLHISLHLSIREQVSIDQPPGIRALHQQFCVHTGSAHAAEHEIMDGLMEMLWQAQRHGTPPDPAIYFACLRQKLQR